MNSVDANITIKEGSANSFPHRIFGVVILAIVFTTILVFGYFPLTVKSGNVIRRLDENMVGDIMIERTKIEAVGAKVNIFPLKPADFDLLYPQETALSINENKLLTNGQAALRSPTISPSRKSPSRSPSKLPTTVIPTRQPTSKPSSAIPSFKPTVAPTNFPTIIPTVDPTPQATLNPTISLTPTEIPTVLPTVFPTFEPTVVPTSPTSEPTADPTKEPTSNPSWIPTTIIPTSRPTYVPTTNPSKIPTAVNPTSKPTNVPTSNPSKIPSTVVPSARPSLRPSVVPSKSPARYPTFAPANDIIYHSPNPVMLGTVKVYHIYYGDFSSTSGQATVSLMNYFASNIGSSDWYNIMTAYYDYTGTHCSASVTYGGSVYLATTTTTGTISDTTAQSAITNAIANGKFPLDSNGLYFFIFRGSITYSGFLTSWCGFHGYFSYGGVNLKYSVIGDPSTATSGGSGCEAITSNTANGNVGADSMASVYAHELVEAVSDPLLNAWYFSSGNENADQCAWSFGSKLPGSTNANIYVGTKTWYIQRNWQPKYGCVLAKV